MKKQVIFKIIIAIFPILFILTFELAFRLFNLFPQIPLFIQDINQNRITLNSTVGERYFNKKSIPVPNIYPQTFSYKKSDDTFRIFCLGGSTTAGFPYEMTVPFPQQLKFMLEHDYPEKKFEVINLGLSAVNSFTVLDWIPEVVKQEPDLVIIYMGHNEFYGAYGAASSISLGNSGRLSRFMLKMQKVRLYNGMKSLANSFRPDNSNMDVTLMEKIVKDRNIPIDSKLRDVTYKNYADNLEIILAKLKKKEIPVVMGNLVSNLQDQSPLDQNDEIFKNAETLEDFIKAKDQDEIPFRAPSQINSIIKEKSRKHGVNYVNLDQEFKNKSTDGIPGDKFFCDHLHPNPVGYHLMAKGFYNQIIKKNIIVKPVKQNLGNNPLFVTKLDWEIGGLRVFKLEQKWPFYNNEAQYSGYKILDNQKVLEIAEEFLFQHHIWGKSHSDLAEYYEGIGENYLASKEYEAVLSMYPEKLDYHLKLIDNAKKSNQWKLLETHATKALTLTSVKGMLYYNIAQSQRNQGKIESAFGNLQKSLDSKEISRDNLAYIFYLKALILSDIRQFDEARKILEVIIQEDPDFAAAKILLNQINK